MKRVTFPHKKHLITLRMSKTDSEQDRFYCELKKKRLLFPRPNHLEPIILYSKFLLVKEAAAGITCKFKPLINFEWKRLKSPRVLYVLEMDLRIC